MYEKFEALLKKYGVTAYRVSKETGVTTATLTSWKQGKYTPKREKLQKIADYFGVTVEEKNDDPHELTAKDERDIAKDMESIRNKLLNGSDGPLSYDGEPIPEEDAELLLGQIELMMRRLKPINKEKYNPNKNKK